MADSLTENFFGRLRHLATTLEKETKQLEHTFHQESSDSEDYEDDCSMKVLHELNSEIRALKGEIQVTIDGAISREKDLAGFLRACKLLKQRTKSDLEQIKDVFEKYGYKPPSQQHSGTEQHMDNLKVSVSGECTEEPSERVQNEDGSANHELETMSASGDFLHLPPLSDFGLSQYQFSTSWGPCGDKQLKTKSTSLEDPQCTSKDVSDNLVLSIPKTPKWASWGCDESYSSRFMRCGMNANDDYTMALFNAKVPAKSNASQGHLVPLSEQFVTNIPTTPAPLTRLSDDNEDIHSPSLPVFRTPGLKTAKQEKAACPATPEKEEPPSSDDTATPSLPQFETPWLKKCTTENQRNAMQKEQEMETVSKVYPEESKELVPLMSCSDQCFQKPVGLPGPPTFMDFDDFLATPQRPQLTFINHDFKVLSVNGQRSKTDAQENSRVEVVARSEKQVIPEDHGKENRSVLACLAPVSEKEYSVQPNYLKRQISLDTVNSGIQKINTLLNRRQMEGHVDASDVVFEESELRSLFEVGPQTRILLLFVTELRRLEEIESQDDRLYKAVLDV
ncbi:spindle and kinetochore-associated protein 3 isoform X2 [Ambystoma mexicanum]|uniref:spindle and kinetochore-associated protein 3 isoform X2 n=1 Tax=Ambystoma mexicanum TaxID=8296 RepID=UPI0037E71926